MNIGLMILIGVLIYLVIMLRRASKIHPTGLFILFFTEMWERMSYYGMRALLVLYMTKYLLADPERFQHVIGMDFLKHIIESGKGTVLDIQPFSSELYGLYTGFVYLSPFFGGILADKVWGKKKSVYIGAFLMAIGHFLMAFEATFLLALFFIIIGNGAFKPNISTQVGNLYKEGDTRRDGAYILFYMGVNLGAFFSPILCATVAKKIAIGMGYTNPESAWHLGFTIAGVGMLIGTVVYHLFRKHLPEESSVLEPVEKRGAVLWKTIAGFFGVMIGFLIFLSLNVYIKAFIIVAILGAIFFYISKMTDKGEKSRVNALVVLCVLTIFFWAIFEQQGNTLQLWADEKANWDILGGSSETYQSFNPFFIFAFAPILDAWWSARAAVGKKTSSVRKMAIGSFLAGIAFLVLSLASSLITPDKSVINMAWLALTTFIFTMGELYLSPIGLSFVSKVAPQRLLSMMMGMWFLSSFIGNYLSGYFGGFYSSMSNKAFFNMFFIMGMGLGIGLLFCERILQKAIGKDV